MEYRVKALLLVMKVRELLTSKKQVDDDYHTHEWSCAEPNASVAAVVFMYEVYRNRL